MGYFLWKNTELETSIPAAAPRPTSGRLVHASRAKAEEDALRDRLKSEVATGPDTKLKELVKVDLKNKNKQF